METTEHKAATSLKNMHPIVVSGFRQDLADQYDAKRPNYTDETTDMILGLLHLDSPKPAGIKYDIVELGAGTGIFTSSFVHKIPQGFKYLATEPMEGFLKKIQEKLPELPTDMCSASACPLPDCSVRFVIAAQCFHWFASTASLQEIHRILIPGGKLVLVWNNKNQDIPWIKVMENLLVKYYDEDTPRAITGKWKEPFSTFTGFTEEMHMIVTGPTLEGDRQAIVDHFCTISVIASLPEDEKMEAESKFMATLNENVTEPEGATLQLLFDTQIYCFVKT